MMMRNVNILHIKKYIKKLKRGYLFSLKYLACEKLLISRNRNKIFVNHVLPK